jgi:hypothetical protein
MDAFNRFQSGHKSQAWSVFQMHHVIRTIGPRLPSARWAIIGMFFFGEWRDAQATRFFSSVMLDVTGTPL